MADVAADSCLTGKALDEVPWGKMAGCAQQQQRPEGSSLLVGLLARWTTRRASNSGAAEFDVRAALLIMNTILNSRMTPLTLIGERHHDY
jgi:hypothetical protein